MRKLILFFSLLPLFSFVILFKGGSDALAQDNLCSYCPDLRPQCSGQSGSQIKGGEFFQCKPGGIDPATGRGTFTICKNQSCVNYEKFQYDGNSIYHVEEAIWSGGSGDNYCYDTSPEHNTFIRRFAAGGTAMKWVDRSLTPGACTTQQGYIKAYDTETGKECTNVGPDKPPSNVNNTLCNTYQGCLYFQSTGVWTENGSILTVGSGAGAGENFYFDKNKGWIGFDRGSGGGNYIETPIGQGTPPEDCKIVSGSSAPPPPVTTGPQCNAQDGGDGDSRPIPCENCNQTNLRIPSCATSFNANTAVSYRTNEGAPFCNGEAWVTKEWDGTVVVDASNTKIPFVGKEDNEDRQKYLADYFEGTCPYYNKNCVEGGRLTKNVGPWQMLASAYVQDDYKTKMIERGKSAGNAKEGGIHNYTVASAFLGLVQHKLSNITPPPKLGTPDYKKKFEEWQKTDSGKLWAYVPMFTREDTPGKIIPYLGSKIFDKFTITNPENQIEKVPHVARLYEVTKAVQNVFFPQGLSLLAGKSAPTIANAKTENEEVANTQDNTDKPKTTYSPSIKSLVQNGIAWIKGLLSSNASAQGDTSSNSCYSISIETEVEPRDDGSFVFVTAKIHSIGGVGGHLRFYVNGVGTIVNSGWDAGSSDTYVVIPRWTMSPYFVPTGGSLPPINFSASTDQCPGNQLVSQACTFSLTADNKLVTNCGKPAVNNPPPSCDLPPAKYVNECQMGARKDTNPNDDLCCDPINIDLFAVDKFVNQDYTNIPGEIETRTQGVSRAIGIALVHPYLGQIWQQTNDPTTGIFNVFKPQDSEPFNDEPAASNIAYSFTRGLLGFGSGSANPPGGNFYFPMLGGIQSAKEWVSERLLLPQR